MDPKYGGPCQGLRSSIPESAKLGMENEVVCLNDPSAGFLDKDDFIIHALGEGKGPWNYNPDLLPWLLSNILKYDVVIVHGLWQYYSYAVKLAFSKLKSNEKTSSGKFQPLPALYVMPHGMLDPYFQKAKGRRLKAIRNWIYWKLVEGRLINSAKAVLFTCEEELRLARESFRPYKPAKEINIGYGIVSPPEFNVNMDKAFANVCNLVEPSPYMLFLSRINEKKGIDLLILAYLRIEKESNIPIAKLVIAGPGLETDYGKKMRVLASESKNIIFLGMITGDAKWGAFYGCEAFVLPSHQENFGIAVVEALACGKPVLISNKINIWQEIIDCKAGLISTDNLTSITEMLSAWVLMSNENKKQMEKNALKCFEINFEIEQSVKRMAEAIFEQ